MHPHPTFPVDDSRWFAEHVQPHEPALRAYLARRFPMLPDHDDVVQEAYARVLKARSPTKSAHPRAFLFVTARNAAIDMFRRRRGVTHEELDDVQYQPLLEESPGVGEALDRQQRQSALLEAVRSLPERCRQVILLRYVDGLPYKMIAERLGISPETVKVHMLRGVRQCTRYFDEAGLLDDAGTPRKDTP